MAVRRRLTSIAFMFACALCASGQSGIRAQELGIPSQNGGMCRVAGPPFADVLQNRIGTVGVSIPRSIATSHRGWRSLLRMTCRISS